MIDPLVSICIPAYNCADYITQTLDCLRKQTYRPLEIIIVNDGSTDQTLEKIKAFDGPGIMIIDVKNGGAAKARNIAYQKARGDYIVFFDADDYVKPAFIDRQLKKIRGKKDVIVLSSWGRFYDNNLKSFRNVAIKHEEMSFEDWVNCYWRNGSPMTTPGRSIIHRELIAQSGLWNESLTLNDDIEFFTRVFLNARKIEFNHEALFYYRSGINGLSGKKDAIAFHSLYNSVLLSTELVLKRYPGSASVQKSCANLWQSILYEIYPQEKERTELIREKIRELGGSDLSFPCGGYTRFMVFFMGWEATKRIKAILNK